MTQVVSPPPAGSEALALDRRPALLGGSIAVVGASVATAIVTMGGASLNITALPVAALGALALVTLAYNRFDVFVITILVVRPIADVSKARAAGDVATPGKAATAIGLLFLAGGAGWLLAQRRQPTPTTRSSRVSIALGAFAFAGFLSVLGAEHRLTALSEAARILAAVMMFVLLERVLTNRRRALWVLVGCFAAAPIPMLLGAYQAASGHGTFASQGLSRVRGTFLHPNAFAFFLAVLVLLDLALLPRTKGRARLLLALFLAPSGVLLVLTYSRGVWVGTAVGILVVGAISYRQIIVIAVVVGLCLLAVPSVAGRLTNVDQQRNLSGTAGNSLVWRVEYWRGAASLAGQNPVTGIGLKMAPFSTDEGKVLHNDFLRAFVEAGTVGLLAYLAVLLALAGAARDCLRRTRGSPDSLARGVAVGFTACVAAYIVVSLAGNLISQVVVLWNFFAVAAVAMALCRVDGYTPIEIGPSADGACVPHPPGRVPGGLVLGAGPDIDVRAPAQ